MGTSLLSEGKKEDTVALRIQFDPLSFLVCGRVVSAVPGRRLSEPALCCFRLCFRPLALRWRVDDVSTPDPHGTAILRSLKLYFMPFTDRPNNDTSTSLSFTIQREVYRRNPCPPLTASVSRASLPSAPARLSVDAISSAVRID